MFSVSTVLDLDRRENLEKGEELLWAKRLSINGKPTYARILIRRQENL